MERRIGTWAIGLDVGGTFIKAALVNRRGGVLARYKVPTEASRGKGKVLQNIAALIESLDSSARSRGGVAAVGLGIPGVLNLQAGVISRSPNFPGWTNLPIAKMLGARIKIPFFLENDANAAALGEKWMGAAKGAQNFCFLTLGTGVGGGLVLEGRIWHGADGMAGEVGHMTIDPDGPSCACGNRGCLEMYASANALQRMIRDSGASGKKSALLVSPNGINGETVCRAARQGDRVAQEAFRQMGSALGIAVSNLVNLLNLDIVILGGGLAAAWNFFIPSLREEVRRRAFRAPARSAKILRSVLGEEAGVMGAAYVAWKGIETTASPQRHREHKDNVNVNA